MRMKECHADREQDDELAAVTRNGRACATREHVAYSFDAAASLQRIALAKDAQAVERPENQNAWPVNDAFCPLSCPVANVPPSLRETPDVRVLGVVAVVAHHEVAVRRNLIGRVIHLSCGGMFASVRIEPRAVDVDAVVL